MDLKSSLSRLNRMRLGWVRDRRVGYQRWVAKFESRFIENLRQEIRSFPDEAHGTLISIVMPVYRPKVAYLSAAIDSVRNQLYQNWELCICDDASRSSEVSAVLLEYALLDRRIKVSVRSENGHISLASNTALSLAAGDYVALLDQDDLLSEHALLLVSKVINKNPEAGIIFSDEDKFDETGRRYGAYFKPAWNLHLFRSHNMISHLGIYKRDLLEAVGGFRKGLEGSQDYDLALRCVERLREDQIIHIPHILYHWRVHEESTAASMDNKPYATLAAVRALDEHLARKGIVGEADCSRQHGYRIKYKLTGITPSIFIRVDVRACGGDTEEILQHIVKSTDYPEFYVASVGSAGAMVWQITNGSIRNIVCEANSNWDLVQYAVSKSNADCIGFLDGACVPAEKSWLKELAALIVQDGIGIVGGKVIDKDGKVVQGGFATGGVDLYTRLHLGIKHSGHAGRAMLVQEITAVSSACMIVKRNVMQDVGLPDPSYVDVALSDIDFCLRARARGVKVLWTPLALFQTQISPFSRRGFKHLRNKISFSDRQRFASMWSHLEDSYFSPHLSPENGMFKLDWERSRSFVSRTMDS